MPGLKAVTLAALLPLAAQSQLYTDVRPVLEKSCLPCHGPQTKSSGLDLSTREDLLKGGDHGPAIVPGDPKASLLYKLISYEGDPHMPYKGDKLPQQAIDRIAAWIQAGAPFEEKAGAEAALFRTQIKPLLEANCVRCHNSQIKRSGLDLSSREALLRGGDTGPVIVPGDAKSSVLFKRISHLEQPGMPFGGQKLPDAAIAQIADWINAGASYDGPLAVAKAGSNHWAFQLPHRPPVPEVKNRAWVRNSIDAFVAAEREKRGLTPVAFADKRTLLRRVYLDLIGLPPTPEEMSAFLADNSKDAYEKIVDKLLASPRYGERWGRHWMDIWRYSDWYGFRANNQVRYSQRHIWHWRDWIIESLNQDKGYDEMIVEMLAGDELAPGNPDIARATGYLARNWYMFDRNVIMKDTVDFTAMAFLGLTLKCARCHSHKYDPITHEDYYRFRAFFEPYDVRTDRVPGQPDLMKDGIPRVYDDKADTPTYRFIRGVDASSVTSSRCPSPHSSASFSCSGSPRATAARLSPSCSPPRSARSCFFSPATVFLQMHSATSSAPVPASSRSRSIQRAASFPRSRTAASPSLLPRPSSSTSLSRARDTSATQLRCFAHWFAWCS